MGIMDAKYLHIYDAGRFAARCIDCRSPSCEGLFAGICERELAKLVLGPRLVPHVCDTTEGSHEPGARNLDWKDGVLGDYDRG